MTPRQKQVYDFILGYVRQHGYSPTFEEIKVASGMKSKSGAFAAVTALEMEGLLIRDREKARRIMPTELLEDQRLARVTAYINDALDRHDAGKISPSEAVDAMRLVPDMLAARP